MGRPIKKQFFGNLNREDYGSVQQGSGVGGEGVASISISNSGTLYSQGATVSFSDPQITGGIKATGTLNIPATGGFAGKIMGINITDSGSGYITAPTVTVTTASLVTQYITNSGVTATNTMSVASVVGIQIGMRIYGGGNGGLVTAVDPVLNRVTSSLPNSISWTNANNLKFYDQGSGFADTVTLTTTQLNAIAFSSYLTTGSSAISTGDIVKQEASRRYLVNNSQGQGQCILVTTSTLAAGQMNIVATDWNGSTYYVKKLTARKAVLVTSTATAGGFLISNGVATGWTLNGATGTIVTIAHTF